MIRLILPKIALVLLLASSLTLDAQINTEKYRKYFSEQKGFMFNMSVGFSGKAGNTEYTAYSGTGRVDYNSKKYATFVVGNFEFKNTAAEKIENNGFMHWLCFYPFQPLKQLLFILEFYCCWVDYQEFSFLCKT